MKIGHLPWNLAPSVSAIKHHSPPNKPNLFQLKKTALGEVKKADLFFFFFLVDYPGLVYLRFGEFLLM